MTNFLAHAVSIAENAPLSEKLMFGLEKTVIGILIVFAVLFLIMLIIYLFQLIFGEKKTPARNNVSAKTAEPEKSPVSAPVPAAPAAVNQEELVAAIAAATAMAQEELIVVLSAAVAAQEGCDPASSRYRIRSFRRIL